MAGRGWEVEFHPAFEVWANQLEEADAEAWLAAIRVLGDVGPVLGRPLVDTIVRSRHPNMKELRPGSTGRTEIRILFALDQVRKAIFLAGGDKSANWAHSTSRSPTTDSTSTRSGSRRGRLDPNGRDPSRRRERTSDECT